MTIAGRVQLEVDGRIVAAALAAGGGPTLPVRLHAAERMLANQLVTKSLLKEVHSVVMNEFQAIADDYASVHYRKMTAANLLVSEIYQAWRKGGDCHVGQP
ncbi:FAD binding domain-containing protein [Paenibacillus hexagrammi]|uniref:CO dehydrogenase flavoprotein C-terminal domain-containing protein n=1 Tax=Paenibacillus hexagrammi TaxID=2908839 RepID=A0ABY3SH61_9BACL|nr:hypothetical protein [Paenibacillus sp. YPD9-1]UJF32700.1 hypothetical protein L0M14_24255 [Paenibacillus sp. YPD9-1]